MVISAATVHRPVSIGPTALSGAPCTLVTSTQATVFAFSRQNHLVNLASVCVYPMVQAWCVKGCMFPLVRQLEKKQNPLILVIQTALFRLLRPAIAFADELHSVASFEKNMVLLIMRK